MACVEITKTCGKRRIKDKIKEEIYRCTRKETRERGRPTRKRNDGVEEAVERREITGTASVAVKTLYESSICKI